MTSDQLRRAVLGARAGTFPARDATHGDEVDEETYAACLTDAVTLLRDGCRVLVDATFRRDRWRRSFIEAARELGVPVRIFLLKADDAILRRRIDGRLRVTPDSADLGGLEQVRSGWEGFSTETRARVVEMDASSQDGLFAQASAALVDGGFA